MIFNRNEKKNENVLYHHGIKGQKWGVKNGPPYPLNSSKTNNRSSSKAESYVAKYNKKPIKSIMTGATADELMPIAATFIVSFAYIGVSYAVNMHKEKKC